MFMIILLTERFRSNMVFLMNSILHFVVIYEVFTSVNCMFDRTKDIFITENFLSPLHSSMVTNDSRKAFHSLIDNPESVLRKRYQELKGLEKYLKKQVNTCTTRTCSRSIIRYFANFLSVF
jgi:hypothetical protein